MKHYIIIIVSAFLYSTTVYSQQTVRLTLEDVLRLALSGNKALRISQLEREKSQEVIREKRSYLLPMVSGNANFTVFAQRPVIFLRDDAGEQNVRPTEVGGTNAFTTGVTATYPILDFQKRSDVKIASISSEIEKGKTGDLSDNVQVEAGITYLRIQFYNEQIRIYTQSLDRNIRALTDSRLLFMQGKGLRTDTLRHYLDVQNLEAAISGLRNESNNQLMFLKSLLGLDMNATVEIIDTLTDGEKLIAGNTDSLIAIALGSRPDVKVGELGVSKANQLLNSAKNETKPIMNVYVQYQLQAQSDKVSFWNYSYPNTAFAGIQLTIPIYSANRVRHKIATANIEIQQAEIHLEDLRAEVKREITSLAANLEDAYLQADTYAKSVEIAKVNFERVRERYNHGISTRLEVADAELALLQARMNQTKSIYIISTTVLRLKKALGQL